MTKVSYDNHTLFNLVIMFIPALIIGPIYILKVARKWYGDHGSSKVVKEFALDLGDVQILFILNICSFSSYTFVTCCNLFLTVCFFFARWIRIGVFEDPIKGEKIMTSLVYLVGFLNTCAAVINNMESI